MASTEYNGWKNRQTWNVALWIGNDEPLYNEAVAYVRRARAKGRRVSYSTFVISAGLVGERTPDGISYTGARLDRAALSEMLRELLAE
jgi:hypothetical protein